MVHKYIYLILLFLPFSLWSQRGIDSIRDSFGYKGYAGGAECPAGFIDISNSGDVIVLSDNDDGSAIFSLYYPFKFYDSTFNKIGVSANGYIVFGANSYAEVGQDFSNDCPMPAVVYPASSLKPRVAVFHDELEATQSSSMVFAKFFRTCPRSSGAYPNEPCTIVQWKNWSVLGNSQIFDFEVILYQWSYAIHILFNGQTPNSATVGIQNKDAKDGVSFPCNPVDMSVSYCFFHPEHPVGGPFADLEVQAEEAPDYVGVGSNFNYLVSLVNYGPSPAYKAKLVYQNLGSATVECFFDCNNIIETKVSSVNCNKQFVNEGILSATFSLAPKSAVAIPIVCTAQSVGTIDANVWVAVDAIYTDNNNANNSTTITTTVTTKKREIKR